MDPVIKIGLKIFEISIYQAGLEIDWHVACQSLWNKYDRLERMIAVIGNWRLREITMWIPSDEGRKIDRSRRESAWNVIVRSIPFVHSATLPRIKTLISGCTTGYTYSYRLPLPYSSSSLFRFCTFYPLSLRFTPLCCSFLASSLSLPLLSTSYYLSFLLPSSQYSLSLSLWLVLVLESVLLVFFKSACQPEKPKRWYPVIWMPILSFCLCLPWNCKIVME